MQRHQAAERTTCRRPAIATTRTKAAPSRLIWGNFYGVFDGTSASGNAEGSFDAYIGRIRIGGLSQGTSGSGGGNACSPGMAVST